MSTIGFGYVWFLKEYFSQLAERGSEIWDSGRAQVGWPDYPSHANALPPLLGPSQAWGVQRWPQLLPVSTKSHSSHLDEAVSAQRHWAPTPAPNGSLQTGLALRAPAPAFCSNAWSSLSQLYAALAPQRTGRTLFRSRTRHMPTCWCICVSVCVQGLHAQTHPFVYVLLMLPFLPWYHNYNTRVPMQANATVECWPCLFGILGWF